MKVRLKDRTASFTDSTQNRSLLIIGDGIYDVEPTNVILSGIRGGALLLVTESEAPVIATESEAPSKKTSTSKKK